MKNFENRRDRYNFFERFENPLLNITVRAEVFNYLPYCKKNSLPPFHFFLFCLFEALKKTENFLYRSHGGEIFKVQELIPSYTVMTEQNILNYTRFENTAIREEFISRSLRAGLEARASTHLINTGEELDPRKMKDYVFVTCIPWLDFTAIEHPVYKFRSADIPSIAWGKHVAQGETLTMPIAVQGHHGFIDGFHIHQLIENLKGVILHETKSHHR